MYYLMQGLVLEIPPINSRNEDLQYYIDRYFKEFCRKYNKYLVLSNGVRQKFQELRWKGNLLQLRSFLERLVLTATKRNITEQMIQKLYEGLYPYVGESGDGERIVVYKAEEALKISGLLEKYRGSRKLVAKELGISTTTLWRKMNKYGIESKYGVDE